MKVPEACGPVSRWVRAALLRDEARDHREGAPIVLADGPVLRNRDAQLALWMIYELCYRGFDDVAAAREWDLGLIELRLELEGRLEGELREATRESRMPALDGESVPVRILTLVEAYPFPKLSAYLRREATAEEMTDFLGSGASNSSRSQIHSRSSCLGSTERPRSRSRRSSTTSTAADVPNACTRRSTPRRSKPWGSTPPTARTSTRSRPCHSRERT